MKTSLIVLVSFLVGSVSSAYITSKILTRSSDAYSDLQFYTFEFAELDLMIRLLDLPDEDMRCKMNKLASTIATNLDRFEMTDTYIINAPGLQILTKRSIDETLSFYEKSNLEESADCQTDTKLY